MTQMLSKKIEWSLCYAEKKTFDKLGYVPHRLDAW